MWGAHSSCAVRYRLEWVCLSLSLLFLCTVARRQRIVLEDKGAHGRRRRGWKSPTPSHHRSIRSIYQHTIDALPQKACQMSLSLPLPIALVFRALRPEQSTFTRIRISENSFLSTVVQCPAAHSKANDVSQSMREAHNGDESA